MANLDRFLEEMQLFEKAPLTGEQIELISTVINRVQFQGTNIPSQNFFHALEILQKWVQRVLQYHTILLNKVKPLHKKCQEIQRDLQEQDQKLTLLEMKNHVRSLPLRHRSILFSFLLRRWKHD